MNLSPAYLRPKSIAELCSASHLRIDRHCQYPQVLIPYLVLRSLFVGSQAQRFCSGLTLKGSNHVLPCRPSSITLDIKKSTHKKFSKWLLAKSSEKLDGMELESFRQRRLQELMVQNGLGLGSENILQRLKMLHVEKVNDQYLLLKIIAKEVV